MTELRQRTPRLEEKEQAVAPAAQDLELQDNERLITVLLYASLLFVTVVGGTGYALVTFGADSASLFAAKDQLINVAERNLFNQFFVKKGWGWTSLAFLLIQIAKPARAWPAYIKPLLRYAWATSYWLLFTTWFFGPSFSDRVLVWTGAKCVPSSYAADHTLTAQGAEAIALNPELCMAGSAALWRQAQSTQILGEGLEGLRPQGRPFFHAGHDVSGHTFLLVHASLFLIAELSPIMPYVFGNRVQQHRIRQWQRWAAIFAIWLNALWWFMLLMTSVYFHSPEEKISGFFVGALGSVVGQYLIGT